MRWFGTKWLSFIPSDFLLSQCDPLMRDWSRWRPSELTECTDMAWDSRRSWDGNFSLHNGQLICRLLPWLDSSVSGNSSAPRFCCWWSSPPGIEPPLSAWPAAPVVNCVDSRSSSPATTYTQIIIALLWVWSSAKFLSKKPRHVFFSFFVKKNIWKKCFFLHCTEKYRFTFFFWHLHTCRLYHFMGVCCNRIREY